MIGGSRKDRGEWLVKSGRTEDRKSGRMEEGKGVAIRRSLLQCVGRM